MAGFAIFMLVFGFCTLMAVAVCDCNNWRPAFGYGDNRTVRVVCDLLEKSEDWKLDDYYARHPVGVELWIANSRYGVTLKVDNKAVELDAWDKTRIWRSFKLNGAGDPDQTALLLANRIIERYGNEKVVPIGRRA